jgi:hypothetical protein
MKILESFNEPQPITWVKQTKNDWAGKFKIKDKNYIIRMVRSNDMPWEISFDLILNGKKTQNVTGTGDALSVFSTVLSGIKQWASRVKPVEFLLSAAEENRKSLYLRLLRLNLPKRFKVEQYAGCFHVEDEAYASYLT